MGSGMRRNEKKSLLTIVKQEWPLHVIIFLPFLFIVVYRYIPMVGILMAFQNYKPGPGMLRSPWVGLENFITLFSMPSFLNAIRNTVIIALAKIILGIIVPVIFSLLLNEVEHLRIKRTIQTIVYLPHFISWVLIAGIIIKLLSQFGPINNLFGRFGVEPIIFLADKQTFPFLMVFTDIWKEFGYASIVYLAAITGIDPNLYEAAQIDGAGRFQKILHITLPGIAPIIILMTALALGRVLDAGFDQIFNLYSPVVYETGDIIDTFVYRMAFESSQFSLSTAAGLFKSAIGCVMLIVSYRLAWIFSGYRVF
jgi:putative aldouronate transport system permease protein